MAKIAFTSRRPLAAKKISGNKGQSSEITQEIEKLAYQFFVERGYEHGHSQEDWLRAEAIVRSRLS